MMAAMVDAVLMDVGGTLWPDMWPDRPVDLDERVDRLTSVAAGVLSVDDARRIAVYLSDQAPLLSNGGRQDADGLICKALDTLEVRGVDLEPRTIRRAICLPASGHVELLPGAASLLSQLAAAKIRVVLVSNALWRDAVAYLTDFAAFGLAHTISAAISSVDVGYRKPHPAMFDAALTCAGAPAERCAVVGDSELNDIIPGRALGCMTVRVAIQEPVPAKSVAHHVVGSLDSVATLLHA
jgi:HAD superfamily hydrolase (TIGR01509 family)